MPNKKRVVEKVKEQPKVASPTAEEIAKAEADRKLRVETATKLVMDALASTNTKFDISVILRENATVPVLKIVSR